MYVRSKHWSESTTNILTSDPWRIEIVADTGSDLGFAGSVKISSNPPWPGGLANLGAYSMGLVPMNLCCNATPVKLSEILHPVKSI
jgi:hypothetical protein